QPQVAYVARERHLRGCDSHLAELVRQLLLRRNLDAADQFQDLPLPIRLGHTVISFKRSRAAANADATACGPVPPATSRDSIPRRGSSSAAKSAVNSGANRCISSADQSAGFRPPRTLSRTNRPTI